MDDASLSSASTSTSRSTQHLRQTSDSGIFARLAAMAGGGAVASDSTDSSSVPPPAAASTTSTTGSVRSSIQERLLSKLLEQVIPVEPIVHDAVPNVQTTKDLQHMPSKPNFSLPIFSNNFRRFNARIGVVFLFQNTMIHLLGWTYPTHTLSAMAIFTFLVLNPILIPMIPPLGTLFYIVIPAYLSRHPPPPQPSLPSLASSIDGPPIAPPKTIAPASDFSTDFLRNMRDLQNVMGDFADGHDMLVAAIAPATNFSDESRSTALFIGLVFACGLLSIFSTFLPWRAFVLIVGWSAFALGHPYVQSVVAQNYEEFLVTPTKRVRAGVRTWTRADIVLDEPPQVAEVEVFELQRRVGDVFSPSSYSTSFASGNSPTRSASTSPGVRGGTYRGVIEYEPWLFSPSCWEPRAPARVSGDRVRGARFFEDVAAPEGWQWKQKKWVLDLASTEWVQARMLGDVEVESEGERWVYDIDAVDAADIDGTGTGTGTGNATGTGKPRRGEWRRRRWTRLVQRKVYTPEPSSPSKSSKK